VRIVVQRVSQAQVSVDSHCIAAIGPGLLLLVGFAPEDGSRQVDYWARKLPDLRLFPDEAGKMNLSVVQRQGKILAVPNFTLQAEVSRGHRPSFSSAAPPQQAADLFRQFVAALREQGVATESGEFGAHMHVSLVNDGPVTLVLEGSPAAEG
jgi:D-aminoacyl-tRNA deacylase